MDALPLADPGLPHFFLGRLVRLVYRQAASVNLTERTVLGLATLSTFRDCLDLGLAEQAQVIIEQVRDELDVRRAIGGVTHPALA